MSETGTPNPQPDAVEETASTDEATETEVMEAGATEPAPEPEAPAETEAESSAGAETDYLSADLLDSITTVTSEQLHAMEVSEEKAPDTALEELINSSVGEIKEDRVIKGRVIGTNDREVLVDIGFKSEGIVAREEFGDGIPQIGDEITVYLVRMEDMHGQTVLSKDKADFMSRWEELRRKSDTGETVMGTVSRRIKGGLIVELGGVPAFLPGSQIDIRPVQDFDNYIGREFEFKIVKLNESRKNIVLSRKELLEADMMEKRAALISSLEVGQVLEGRVKNITDFGAFVDLGGLDGLLHITDLSWGRVQHPSEVVSLDEDITVKVIDFDAEKQRVSLGLKQLQPHPWDSVDLKYPAGIVITGKVVSMTNYGAFVELEKGVEGLVHVSEMSWTKHIRHPSEMFTLGESIETKILSIDSKERKISLGVKQLQPDPWDHIEEKYAVNSTQKGIVRNLTQFGAFVELEEGIDGLIHVTDLSWTKNVRHPKEILDKGDKVEVKILDVSRENRRIALGYKQIGDDPWDSIEAHFTSGKQVQGTVFRILEKGVILQMEMDIEGIIPSRDMTKSERQKQFADLEEGAVIQATVQEINVDDKKIVLMPDFTKISAGPPAEIAAEEKPAKDAAKEKSAEQEAVEEPKSIDAEQVPAELPVETEEAAATAEGDEAPAEIAEEAPETAAIEPEPEKPKKKTAAKKKATPKSKADAEADKPAAKPKKAVAKKKVAGKVAKKTVTDEKKAKKPAAKKKTSTTKKKAATAKKSTKEKAD